MPLVQESFQESDIFVYYFTVAFLSLCLSYRNTSNPLIYLESCFQIALSRPQWNAMTDGKCNEFMDVELFRLFFMVYVLA